MDINAAFRPRWHVVSVHPEGLQAIQLVVTRVEHLSENQQAFLDEASPSGGDEQNQADLQQHAAILSRR